MEGEGKWLARFYQRNAKATIVERTRKRAENQASFGFNQWIVSQSTCAYSSISTVHLCRLPPNFWAENRFAAA
jgi:hypothetical protein